MAESLEFRRSIDLGSDHVPIEFCEPCYEVDENIKPVAGYCKNCNENLCIKCYTGHLRRKLFQDHTLVDKSTKPKTKSTQQAKPQNLDEECLLHYGETLQSFCQSHSQLCCKVCVTIDHQVCKTEKISKIARHVQGSQELQDLIEKFNILKKGFNDNLLKTEANEIVIQKNHRDAINEMNKLQDEFDKLMTEAKSQAERVKEEDFNKIEKVAATCNIVGEQIHKLTTNLDKLREKGENERLFVSMKRAESQLKSLEGNREKIDKENMVRGYKFEPDARLITLLNDLHELGQLLFEKPGNTGNPQQIKALSVSYQSMKPTFLKDITISSSDTNLCGLLVLPNNQVMITDCINNKLKVIDTKKDKTMSEIQLSCKPHSITKVKDNEFAVTFPGSPKSKIQFVSISKKSLSKGREISVNGRCRGIAYNASDNTFIIATDDHPGYIQIINMAGSVIKCLEKDSKADQLFAWPMHVVLSPDMTDMYVTDAEKHTVTLMTTNGNVKNVYEDKSLQNPNGICVTQSGLVYVVGRRSDTVHHIDPVNGTFKLFLDQKDGLLMPLSISYSDLDDKMYIGMQNSRSLKVFQMK